MRVTILTRACHFDARVSLNYRKHHNVTFQGNQKVFEPNAGNSALTVVSNKPSKLALSQFSMHDDNIKLIIRCACRPITLLAQLQAEMLTLPCSPRLPAPCLSRLLKLPTAPKHLVACLMLVRAGRRLGS